MPNLTSTAINDFCERNFKQLCVEAVELSDTAVLPQGKLRELVSMLEDAGAGKLATATGMISHMALRLVAEMPDAQFEQAAHASVQRTTTFSP